MRGDIILYRSSGNLYERFITHFTHGPYVHIAVDCGDGTNIAAHPRGISKEPNAAGTVLISTGEEAAPEDLFYAMHWLELQVGKQYGWMNILDSALGILGLPIYFFQKGHNDCSTLVAKYLLHLNPHYWIEDSPDLVSPNDIARFFKAI